MILENFEDNINYFYDKKEVMDLIILIEKIDITTLILIFIIYH